MARARRFLLEDDDDRERPQELRVPFERNVYHEPDEDDGEELTLAPREVVEPPKEWTLTEEEWEERATQPDEDEEEEEPRPLQFSLRTMLLISTYLTVIMAAIVSLEPIAVIFVVGLLSLLGLAIYAYWRKKADRSELFFVAGFVAFMVVGVLLRKLVH